MWVVTWRLRQKQKFIKELQSEHFELADMKLEEIIAALNYYFSRKNL